MLNSVENTNIKLKNTRRIASITFSSAFSIMGAFSCKLFAQTLSALPEGTKMLGMREDPARMVFYIFFESDKFKETPDHALPPEITPHYSRYLDSSGMAVDRFDGLDMSQALQQAQGCSHEWKEYQGVMYKYNYCIKCGVKENE